MSLMYRVMYAVGFAPWDTGAVPVQLTALVEGEDALPTSQALDVGCGTGTQAVYLARHGWRVTGVDQLPKPLAKARARAAADGVDAEFVRGSVTGLDALVGDRGPFALVHDRGCFHGLGPTEREAYVAGVTAVTAPGATLLMMAFARNRKLGGPNGIDADEIPACFGPSWEIVASERSQEPPPSGPMRDVALFWHRLRRAG